MGTTGNDKKKATPAAKAKSTITKKKAKVNSSNNTSGEKSTPAKEKILEVLAGFYANGDKKVSKDKVANAAGIKPKTLVNNIPKLKDEGLIEVDKDGMSLTPKGLEQVGDLAKGAASNDEAHDKIKKELKGKELAFFEALLDGKVHAQDAIAKALGYDAKQKGFINLKGKLSGQKIVHYPATGMIQLNIERCFPFGIRE